MRYWLGVLSCVLAFSPLWARDTSDNFVLTDEQGRPLAAEEQETVDERPLVKDDGKYPSHTHAVAKQVEDLQQEIQELRGQLDVQAHELSVLKNQQLQFYKDLDGRLQNQVAHQTQPSTSTAQANLATAAVAPAPQQQYVAAETVPTQAEPISASVEPPVPSGHAHNPADEQIAYLAAYSLVQNKKYAEAITAMETFVKTYPRGGYVSNAEYWLGELYLVQHRYPEALMHFTNVVKQYPSSQKVPASTLKMGYAFLGMHDIQNATKQFQEVMQRYPDTQVAKIAKTKLETSKM